MRWDEGLQGAARHIAEESASPLRIIAGPGTGKTFALMRRVARLLQEDAVEPSRILVCTFTRTAASDLEKALAELEIDGVERIHSGTLHAVCFRILSRAEVLTITGRVPRPLLQFEERFLIEDHASGFGGVREADKRLKAFNAAWARLQSEEPGWPSDPADRLFSQSLLSWLRFHKGILIGELVPETLRYLRDNPLCPEHNAYDHILVDEYQDLNKAEQTLLDMLAQNGKLTVVGDEDQSIYSFKYAHPEGIAHFDQTHTDTHDDPLDLCRRCPCVVIEMANCLISNNVSRDPRVLSPIGNNPPGEAHIVQWPSMAQEAAGIARFVSERINSGLVSAGKVLILAPRREFGYAVRDAINGLGIPAHSFFSEEAFDGSPKDLQESKSQQAFSLLTLVASREDHVALRCWCGYGSPSLRRGAWAALRAYCEENEGSPLSRLAELAAGTISIPRTGELVNRYGELQELLQPLQDLQGTELADALFPREENWTEPFRSVAYSISDENFDAGDLLDTLRTWVTQPELPADVDYVRVMSLHKSKGLTADLVVVVGCMEGLIPTHPSDGVSADERRRYIEEQRRLFYVATTRTTQTLVLSGVTHLPGSLAFRMRARIAGRPSATVRTIASTFLAELGPLRPTPMAGTAMAGL